MNRGADKHLVNNGHSALLRRGSRRPDPGRGPDCELYCCWGARSGVMQTEDTAVHPQMCSKDGYTGTPLPVPGTPPISLMKRIDRTRD